MNKKISKVLSFVVSVVFVVLLTACGDENNESSVSSRSVSGCKTSIELVQTYLLAYNDNDYGVLLNLFPDEFYSYYERKDGITKQSLLKEVMNENGNNPKDIQVETFTIVNEETISGYEWEKHRDNCKSYLAMDIESMKYIELKLNDNFETSDAPGEENLLLTAVQVGDYWYIWGFDGDTFDEDFKYREIYGDQE